MGSTWRLGMNTPSKALRGSKTPSQRATYPLALSSSHTAWGWGVIGGEWVGGRQWSSRVGTEDQIWRRDLGFWWRRGVGGEP